MPARGVRLGVLAAALALVSAAPPSQEGRQFPRRVVSLVPAATESLFALGVGDRVVGVSSHDRWPPEIEELPRVGALLDPDSERIVTLRPDLVIVDPSHHGLVRQLGSVGIDSYPWSTGDLDSLYRHLTEVGDLLRIDDAATALVGRIRRQLAAVAAAAPAGPRPVVLLVFGRRPGGFAELWVSGGVGFLHELVGIAGGDNRFADVHLPGFKAGLETLLAAPPDVVVELAAGAEAAVAHDRLAAEWRALPGFGDVEVGVLSDPGILVPGPRVPELARRMAEILRR